VRTMVHVFDTLNRLQSIQDSVSDNINQTREYESEDAVTTTENVAPQYSGGIQGLIAAVLELLTVLPRDDTLDGNQIASDGSGSFPGGLGGEAMAQSGADTELHPRSNSLGPSTGSAHNVTTVTGTAVTAGTETADTATTLRTSLTAATARLLTTTLPISQTTTDMSTPPPQEDIQATPSQTAPPAAAPQQSGIDPAMVAARNRLWEALRMRMARRGDGGQ